MDRHRQDWLDFDCSDQVWLEIQGKHLARFAPNAHDFFSISHGQSKNATCDEYASDDSSTVYPVTQGVEGTTPQFNPSVHSCDNEGEAEAYSYTHYEVSLQF